ncbi:ribonuclease H-like domain-containing protein [Tanacetum coccineum]
MTGNKAYLAEYQDYNGGPITFGGSKGYITGKGKIKTGKLDFKDTECLVLSSDFKLPDENQVLLRIPRQNNMYCFNIENIVPSGGKPCKNTGLKTNEGKKPNKNTGLKTNEEPVDQEDQAFLEELKRQEKEANDVAEALRKEFAQYTEDLLLQLGAARATSTNTVNTASTPVSTASPSGGLSYHDLTYTDQDDSQIPALEDIYDNPNDGIFTNASYDDESAVTDFTNLETIMNVSPIPTSRIHSIHPSNQILGDPKSAVQTRSKVNKSYRAHAFISKVLEDENLPYRKKAIGTKWVYRNKKDKRGVVVRNKARIEAIMIFLAFASYMGFIVYHMDMKSAFLYGTIDKEVYVSQPPGFVDPKFPKKVYKVVKALYGLHQAPLDAWPDIMKSACACSSFKESTNRMLLHIWPEDPPPTHLSHRREKMQTIVLPSTTRQSMLAAATAAGQGPRSDTAWPDVDAARQEVSAVEPRTPPITTSIFDDEDITMAQTLIKMKEEKAKEKGVQFPSEKQFIKLNKTWPIKYYHPEATSIQRS